MTKNPFWDSPTYKIIKLMKATGNRSGVIRAWKESVERWAMTNPGDIHAAAALAWLPMWETRPYYTAAELAPIWPVLSVALGVTERPLPYKSSARLEHEMEYGGLPNFTRDGKRYFVVEQLHRAEEFHAVCCL